MDFRDSPFGMGFGPPSAHDPGFHFNPISAQSGSVQPEASNAGPSIIFHGATGSSNATYQNQPEVQPVHHEDLQMVDARDELVELPPAAAEPPAGLLDQDARKSQRNKYAELDWEAQKQHIQKLYFDENKTLSQVRDIMRREHSFNAPDKPYKKKFSDWGWQKNLPVDTALFMVQKAKQRKQSSNKDTIFHFGEREWPLQKAETTVSRSKRQRGEERMNIVETPRGVTYETPAALVLSPGSSHAYNDEEEEDIPENVSDNNSEVDDSEDMLRLTWDGHTGPEFLTLWKTALESRDQGKADEAEGLLERAWNGLRHISGVTHEDTNKVAYSLASLYADTGRLNEAVALVERTIQDHVKTLGYENRTTQQRVLLAADILNGWNRHAEALGLLSRSKELLDRSGPGRPRRQRKATKGRRVRGKELATGAGSENEVSLLLADGFGGADPAKINWGLTVARRQVLARSEGAEVLLQAIITRCETNPEENLRHHLVARGELLALYEKLGVAAQHRAAFQGAVNALDKVWESVDWEEDRFERFEIMEASLQLIANMLKSGYQDESRQLFEDAVELATTAFGSTDERTIWILITIGIVYQTHMEWSDARNWFEQAFAAALDEWGRDSKDGIVKSLQNALDREHFSYVSDEGRPYKTVFGVSGIHITPGRLHLE